MTRGKLSHFSSREGGLHWVKMSGNEEKSKQEHKRIQQISYAETTRTIDNFTKFVDVIFQEKLRYMTCVKCVNRKI